MERSPFFLFHSQSEILSSLLVAGVSFALFALRVFKFRNQWNLLDLILLLNIAQVLIAFITHPFGLNASGSERVGARPYFNIAIATVGYFILSNQSVSPRLETTPNSDDSGRTLLLCLISSECASKSIGFVLGKVYLYLPPTYHTGLVRLFRAYDRCYSAGCFDRRPMLVFSTAGSAYTLYACGGPFCFYLGSR